MNEQQKMIPKVSDEVISITASQAKQQLMTFFSNHMTELLGAIRSYVLRMGLAQGQAVPDVALDVLQETAVEALAHLERFRPDGQPMAWVLGIALNVIKRKKVAAAKLYQREVAFGRLALLLQPHDAYNENDLFDVIAPFYLPDPESDPEANEQASLILSLVSREDQHVLRLSILHDFDRSTLACALGVTPVTARVRLHRALSRLRFAWNELQRQELQLGIADVAERRRS